MAGSVSVKSKTGSTAGKQAGNKLDYEFIGSKEEFAESRTITSRTRVRNKVEDDIAAFLSRGGTISEIAPDVTAPPENPRVITVAGQFSPRKTLAS